MAKKQKTRLGCLFWMAVALLIVVVFLYNKETINNVLLKTGFLEVLEDGDYDLVNGEKKYTSLHHAPFSNRAVRG